MRAILQSNAIRRALAAGPYLGKIVPVDVFARSDARGAEGSVKTGHGAQVGRFVLAQAIVTSVKQTAVAGRAILRGAITSSKRVLASETGQQLLRGAVTTHKSMAVAEVGRLVFRGSTTAIGDNAAPVWGNVPTITAYAGIAGSYDVSQHASDADGDPLQISRNYITLQAGFTYNPATKLVQWDESATLSSTSGHVFTADDGQDFPLITIDVDNIPTTLVIGNGASQLLATVHKSNNAAPVPVLIWRSTNAPRTAPNLSLRVQANGNFFDIWVDSTAAMTYDDFGLEIT